LGGSTLCYGHHRAVGRRICWHIRAANTASPGRGYVADFYACCCRAYRRIASHAEYCGARRENAPDRHRLHSSLSEHLSVATTSLVVFPPLSCASLAKPIVDVCYRLPHIAHRNSHSLHHHTHANSSART